MGEQSKTIIEQKKNSTTKEIVNTTLCNAVKAASSLVPFFGEFLNSTIPDIYRICKASYFNDFLMGINLQLQENSFTKDDYDKFEEKLSNPSAYSYLSAIIDSVFFSKSKRVRTILGIITSNYINDNTMPYEDIIIVNALKELIDDEIDMFIKIYEVAIGDGKEDANGAGAFYMNYYPERTLVNTTFFKLQNLNIIGDKAESLTSKSPGSLHGNVTLITERLKHYIDLTKKQCS